MNKVYFRILNIITTSVAIMIIVGTLFWSGIRYKNMDFSYYSNEIRTKLSNHRYELEQGNYIKSEYDYVVIDLDGEVLYKDGIWKCNIGDKLVVEEVIQQDKSFSKDYKGYQKMSLVLKDSNEKLEGFVVYLIPESYMDEVSNYRNLAHVFLPAIIGAIISSIILISKTVYTNKRILKPLSNISTSAEAIISGNYDLEVQRVFGENLKNNEVGELTYSFEMMRDELKAKQISEQSLRKAQQELMSCISHDLRTPISTIKAYSEGMRDGVIMEGMSEEDYLRIILEKTNLLEKMIGDLLEYSNAELNKMYINPKEVYFKEYMLDLVREIKIYVKQQGIDFESEIMDENLLVSMDEKRITEVVYNLIENSLKYSTGVDSVIRLEAKIDKGVASIHVIDNGVGISASDIPYVFDKFYRAEKSRSSNVPGSGLGLSICRHIVNQHGGEIYCRSRKSQGSEFWFTLNAHE